MVNNFHKFGFLKEEIRHLINFPFERNIVKKLDKEISNIFKCKKVIFTISGRVGLYILLKKIKILVKNRNILLIPDYICNVVPKAVKNAGLKPVYYKTDAFFKLSVDHVSYLLDRYRKNVAGILLASILGSENDDCETITTVKKLIDEETLIIVDNAQNLYSFKLYCPLLDASIFSFNEKNVPGVMGGGICLYSPRVLKLFEKDNITVGKYFSAIEFFLLTKYINRLMLYLSVVTHRKSYPPKMEYTIANKRPYYKFLPLHPGKFSLCIALHYLTKLPQIEQIRRENYYQVILPILEKLELLGTINIIRTKYIDVSPFVPFEIRKSSQKKSILQKLPFMLKGPYSIEGYPKKSLRPNLIYVINPFFHVST